MGSMKFVNASLSQLSIAQLAYSDASAVLSEAKSAYIGSTQVFSKGYSGTLVTVASGLAFLATFTPSVNMSLDSFSMILSTTRTGVRKPRIDCPTSWGEMSSR
jgi:hypothetical protein